MKEKKEAKRIISKESAEILSNLYSTEYKITDLQDKPIEIDQQGSMALLCTGYRGLIAIRKYRKDIGFKNPNEILTKQTKNNETEK
ncbi:MAG: hypothetical protein CVU11_11460 [Bacteroidetes bacterium HGW-Bacteroidetes-6]|jgi:hypothetical protein|nr:MAG: hypothetical protein CVU11_11460 [Bacteroidetes bacterium HGW-Bacteroidetes-6]